MIQQFTLPQDAAAYGNYIQSLISAGELYHERIDCSEYSVLTGADMPEKPLPASVYIEQLHRALDRLDCRAAFDTAMSGATVEVQSWLNSGGELLTSSPNFATLLPAESRDQILRLAATL